jgi:hypothetical protein
MLEALPVPIRVVLHHLGGWDQDEAGAFAPPEASVDVHVLLQAHV